MKGNSFNLFDMSIKAIVQVGLISALAFISTTFLRIPISFGYIHLGDLILVLAISLDKRILKSSLFGAAISMGMADLYLGFPQYIGITIFTRILIIFLCLALNKKKGFWGIIFLAIPVNYFLLDLSVLSLESAIFFLPFNIIQIIPVHLVIFSYFGVSIIGKRKKIREKSLQSNINDKKVLKSNLLKK